jgi:hypothetical protein
VNRIGLSLLLSLSLGACSREPQPAETAAATPSAATATAASDTVAAVAQGGVTGPVSVRFAIEERPTVGVATNLRLEFSSAAPQSGVSVRIEGESLGIDPAGSQKVIDLPEPGKPVSHTLRFMPQAPGIFDAAVHVLTQGDQAREAVYAIPVLVDATAAAPTAASPK